MTFVVSGIGIDPSLKKFNIVPKCVPLLSIKIQPNKNEKILFQKKNKNLK